MSAKIDGDGTNITRKQAIDRGLTRYFTGIPCHRDHICDRRVKRRECVQCVRESGRGWYGRNLDKKRACAKRFVEKNPDKVYIYGVRYREKYREKRRVKDAEKQRKARLALKALKELGIEV